MCTCGSEEKKSLLCEIVPRRTSGPLGVATTLCCGRACLAATILRYEIEKRVVHTLDDNVFQLSKISHRAIDDDEAGRKYKLEF